MTESVRDVGKHVKDSMTESVKQIETELRNESTQMARSRRELCQMFMRNGKQTGNNIMWQKKETAWSTITKQYESGEETVFFDDVGLAADGGLSEIGRQTNLWHSTRFLGAALNVGCFVYNVYYILKTDIPILEAGSYTTTGHYLITASIFQSIVGSSSFLISTINDDAVLIILGIEVCMLCLLLLDVLRELCTIAFFPGYKRWHAVRRLCLDRIPQVASYSSLKLLYFVTPHVLTQEVCQALFYSADHHFLRFIWIVLSRPFMAIIGIDCFLIRYRAVETAILTESVTVPNLLDALIFINQVLGVVMLTWAIRARLYRFVFAGEDGVMNELERNRQEAWDARVAKVIWERYKLMQSIAILLSWSDDDLQAIIIAEPGGLLDFPSPSQAPDPPSVDPPPVSPLMVD